MAPAQYLISLCTIAQESNESFGIATRIGSSSSIFQFEAAKVIQSILTFSPAPDSVAVQFLHELQKIRGISILVEQVLNRASQFDCPTWAENVIDHLRDNFTPSQRSEAIKPVTDLAAEMLSHLLIAARNPGGKKTPQETIHPTPDIAHLHGIVDLLSEARTRRSQSALKELLFWRDGFRCLFTGQSFDPAGRHVGARGAHILPFSFHDKPLTLKALETFTGRQLAEEVKQNINHPCNAFNAESNAHESFDKLAWGIEAVQDGNKWRYYFREIRPKEISPTITLIDGQEVIFQQGLPDGRMVDKPSPEYCNVKLALARALHGCGAADVIDEVYGDDDDEALLTQPVYLGGPFVSEDVLLRRLEDRLLT